MNEHRRKANTCQKNKSTYAVIRRVIQDPETDVKTNYDGEGQLTDKIMKKKKRSNVGLDSKRLNLHR